MFKLNFGPTARNCPSRARKLEMTSRRKPVRRPLEAALDEQFSAFEIDEFVDSVPVTARTRPFLWDLPAS